MAYSDYQGPMGQQQAQPQQQQKQGSGGFVDFLKSLLGPVGASLTGDSSGGTLGNLFGGGSQGGVQQHSLLNPQQMDLQSLIGQYGKQALTNPGQSPIAQEARHNFNTQTIPSIAERFTAMGGSDNKLNSSGFQAALGNAGAGLNRSLASLDYQQAHQLNQQALRPQFENIAAPKQSNEIVELLLTLLPFLLGI
jgi:hypothetical protein